MDIYQKKFNKYLKTFFIKHPKLGQYYDICEGGKRLRPIIVLLIASHLKSDWENSLYKSKVYDLALIIELIHSTSLIIDDLPSMDNDDFRRNQLTFHYKYGKHQAYLMVYNLLTVIKKLILNLNSNLDLDLDSNLDLEELINVEIGNLILGQKLDLNPKWKPNNPDESRALKIAEYKTASLFKLSVLGPYLLLKPFINLNNSINSSKFLNLGHHLGMAFQLSDDYLDLKKDFIWNNYGLETTPEDLVIKFQEYLVLIDLDLEVIKLSDPILKNILKEIIDLMKDRFPKIK